MSCIYTYIFFFIFFFLCIHRELVFNHTQNSLQVMESQFSWSGLFQFHRCTINSSYRMSVCILVVPAPGVTIASKGNTSVQLSLQYNTLYAVSVTHDQPDICGRPNQTAFIHLNYSKCQRRLCVFVFNCRMQPLYHI